MKKLKILIAWTAMFNFIAVVNGQDRMTIHLADNTNSQFRMTDIQRITFNDNNMLLKTVNGATNSYLLDNIASITFFDDPIAIKEIDRNIEVNVYLNAYGDIVVESPCSITGLTVFDLTGKAVTNTTFSSPVHVNHLSTGVYLLKVETTQGTVSKKFIKNR